MSDYDHRNQAFDYAPPTRSGSGWGALAFIGGIVLLFILGMVFMGPAPQPVEGDGALPAPDPVVTAPADGSLAPAPTE